MNENDFDERPIQLFVCALGEDCASATKAKHGHPMAICDALKAARNEAGLKRQLYVTKTGCQGWCQYAPVIQIQPGGRIFKNVDPAEAKDLVREIARGDESRLQGRQLWDYAKSRAENLKMRPKEGDSRA